MKKINVVATLLDFVRKFSQNSAKKAPEKIERRTWRLSTATAAVVGILVPSAAHAVTFNFQSSPNHYTATYGDGNGNTFTVVGSVTNDLQCLNVGQNVNLSGFGPSLPGRFELWAIDRVGRAPECNDTIELSFTTNGFKFQTLLINDIDDVDANEFRDGFAFDVPGTWASPSINIHSIRRMRARLSPLLPPQTHSACYMTTSKEHETRVLFLISMELKSSLLPSRRWRIMRWSRV